MYPCLCKSTIMLHLQAPDLHHHFPKDEIHIVGCSLKSDFVPKFQIARLFRQDITVPGKRVLVSFGKTRGSPSTREQYTAFLLWRLAGFSALAWDHCRLKSGQWQCEGAGVNLNLSLSPEFRFVEAGRWGWRVVFD